MIRINLLPVRAAKKKESRRFQTTIGILMTAFFTSLAIIVYMIYVFDVRSVKAEIRTVDEENAKIMKKIGELSKIKEEKARVQEKLDIVDKLEAGRSGPVEMLTKIASSIPTMASLQSMTEDGKTLKIKGYAADKEVVADFMRKLRVADPKWKPELGQMVLAKVKNQEAVTFDLQISLAPAAPAPEPNKKGKGKK